jgi:hypothetical protein
MKSVLFTFCTVFFALWLEVSLSIFGIVAPALMVQIFYITVVKKWRFAFLVALVACTLLDSLVGYYSLPAVTLVIIIASFWRGIGDCSRVELQFVPIGMTVFLAMIVLFLTVYLSYGGAIPFWQWCGQLLIAVVFAAISAPVMIRFEDWLAGKLKILAYTEIQREEMYSAAHK